MDRLRKSIVDQARSNFQNWVHGKNGGAWAVDGAIISSSFHCSHLSTPTTISIQPCRCPSHIPLSHYIKHAGLACMANTLPSTQANLRPITLEITPHHKCIIYLASRDIQPDEELTYPYHSTNCLLPIPIKNLLTNYCHTPPSKPPTQHSPVLWEANAGLPFSSAVEKVPGDGNCFFYAVSKATGIEWQIVKEAIILTVEENPAG